jgi:hypothetical protein
LTTEEWKAEQQLGGLLSRERSRSWFKQQDTSSCQFGFAPVWERDQLNLRIIAMFVTCAMIATYHALAHLRFWDVEIDTYWMASLILAQDKRWRRA